MKWTLILLVVVGLGGFLSPVAAQDKPVVAMIGTGTLADTFGPAIGRAGYPLVYGSRDPARESVRALVEKTGSNASAATQREATANAQIVIPPSRGTCWMRSPTAWANWTARSSWTSVAE